MKTCSKCHQEKTDASFYRSRGTSRSECIACEQARRIAFHEANPGYFADKTRKSKNKCREYLKAVKNQPCADCGVSYPYYVMDFDHKGGKVFNIGAGRGVSMARLKSEVAKCDVVCSNCHRERSWGNVT